MIHSDKEIDRIIWEAIAESQCKSDFICYIIHSPMGAAHLAEARDKMEKAVVPLGPALAYVKAVQKIRDLAEGGDPCATFHMGKICSLGIGTMRDVHKAVDWYRKAMALGEARAFANMGWFYQDATGVERDMDKAFELLSKAADEGVLSAKTAVGTLQLKGKGCEKDVDAGLKKIEEAFAAGYMNAGNHLADLYAEGALLPKDAAKSHYWLQKVAEAGDDKSMAMLGHRLITGSHGVKDVDAGLAWMHKAMENKFHPAFLWLAGIYRRGNGLPQNIGQTINVLQRGIAAGSIECAQALEQLMREQGIDNNMPTTLQ